MDKRLQEFFINEQDQGRLDFEADPEYAALLEQSLSLFPDGDLPNEIGCLMDVANGISFAYGLKLGLRLKRWGAL